MQDEQNVVQALAEGPIDFSMQVSQLSSMGLAIHPGGAHFMSRALFQKTNAESEWKATGHQLIAAPAILQKCPRWGSANIVVVGKQIYVESRFIGLKEYTHLLTTRYFVRESTLFNMASYSGLMQYLVQAFDFQQRTIAELGSADAHASMVAKINGAKKVIAIECDPKWEEPFRWNRDRYQLTEEDLQFWNKDFTDPSCIRQLRSITPQVIIANVGPFYKCHNSLIQLVCDLPVQWFIAGGYVCPNDMGIGEHAYPTSAISQLMKAGFKIVKQVSAVVTGLGFKDEECENQKWPTMAFVAFRP